MNVAPLKIVVLDGRTANPGDLDWAPLEALGQCTIYPRTSAAETKERVCGAEAVFTNKVRIGKEIMDSAPGLRYIGVLATGYDVIDLPEAAERGIVVTNIPAYSTASVAQNAIALLLELTNHTGHHDRSVRQGRWAERGDFSYWEKSILELNGLTMGIIGWGEIGRSVGRIAQALGMPLLVQSRSRREPPEGVKTQHCGLETLLAEADVISLHCPLNAETKNLIRRETIDRMKSSAILLNTARGGLVMEQDLADALNSGRIAGAGLDVLSAEPPDAANPNPLLTAKNCILTPHYGWASIAARQRLIAQTAANLEAYLAMRPINIVYA